MIQGILFSADDEKTGQPVQDHARVKDALRELGWQWNDVEHGTPGAYLIDLPESTFLFLYQDGIMERTAAGVKLTAEWPEGAEAEYTVRSSRVPPL